MDFKFYSDVLPMHSVPIFEELDIVSQSDPEAIQKFKDFDTDETITRYAYKESKEGKIYKHVVGYSIELLVPQSIKVKEYPVISDHFMSQFLEPFKKVPWVASAVIRGDGMYIKIFVLILKKYGKSKQEFITYQSDGYRHNTTKKMVARRGDRYYQKMKINDEVTQIEIPSSDVVLAYKKGGIKSIRDSHWSKRERIFEMPRSEFRLSFLPFIKKCLLQSIRKIKLIRDVEYFKYLKHKSYSNSKKTAFYNKNARCFNGFVYEMNLDLVFWEYAIYSDSGYYQDPDLVSEWIALKQRYFTRIKEKHFNYSLIKRKIKLSINPFIRTDVFRENIDSLRDMFKNDLQKFIQSHISIDI